MNGMPSNRWVDRTQPQTLMMATILMYVNAALSVLLGVGLRFSLLGLPLIAGQVAAGWGIANEKKWGYWLGVGLVVLLLAEIIVLGSILGGLISILFYGALLALLLHPESRAYRRTWFR
jgi:hypothetical protein